MPHGSWWNDGRSAHREPVRVRLFGRRLLVTRTENDDLLVELPLDGLALAEEVYRGQPLRFRHDDWPDARLTVSDHALMGKLIAARPQLARRYHAAHGTSYRLVTWGGVLLLTVGGLFGLAHFGAEPLAAMVPAEWEESLGESALNDFVRAYGACERGSGALHLEALAGELAATTDSPYRFSVRLLASDEVNAFALPGGRIAIFAGLVNKAEGPNEVAGVLAHEVAHGIERHAMEQIVRRSSYSALVSLVTGDMSGFAALVGDAAAFAASMANSRADEAEADELAIRLLNAAGIDSTGLPRFFAKLEPAGADSPALPALVSTHPATTARLQETRALARPGRDALTPEQWQAVRSACGTGSPDQSPPAE